MAATINADNGVVSGTSGLKSTADTSGVLALQSNGSTALSIGTNLNVTLTNPLPVASGGTGGSATPTAGGVNYGTGTAQAYTSAGTSGQVLTSAGSSAPTWADAPAPVPTFTASGSISAAGVTVALNSDGTVSAISGTTTSFSAGTSANLPSNRTGQYSAAAYDPVNQKVVVLVNYSSFLMGYVGTISGTTITFGSEYQVVTSSVTWLSVAYDTTNAKFVVLYATANTERAKVLTVTGTAISAGTEKTLTNSAGYVGANGLVYNPVGGNFIAMANDSSSFYTSFWLLTISGTTLTENYYPTSAAVTSFNGNAITCNPTTGTVVMVGRSTVSGSTYVYAYTVTVSGATINVGNATQISATDGGAYPTAAVFGNANTGYGILVAYNASGTNNALLIRVGTEVNGSFVFGGTYSYGSGYSFSRGFAIQSNPAGSNVCITWGDGNSGYAIAVTAICNTNGNVVFGSANNLFTPVDSGAMPALAYCTNISKMVIVMVNNSNARFTTLVFTPDGYSSTAQNFIGFSTGSAANGASVGVSTYASVNSNVSGLTLGSRYNVTYTGTLTTSTTGFPFAGTAYGATKIRVGV